MICDNNALNGGNSLICAMTQLAIFGPAKCEDRAVCGDSCAVPPTTGDLAHAYAT